MTQSHRPPEQSIDSSRYHCCASCIHFRAERTGRGVHTYCNRLGYDTHPKYQFDCWTPKPRVRARIFSAAPTEDSNL